MFLCIFVVVCFLSTVADAIWYKDLTSSSGLQFGDLVFRLEDTNAVNRSLEDRLAFRVDYGDVEVCARHSKDDDGIELDFFMDDEDEDEGEDGIDGCFVEKFFCKKRRLFWNYCAASC